MMLTTPTTAYRHYDVSGREERARPYRDRASFRQRVTIAAILSLALCSIGGFASADEEGSKAQMQSLDEQVQEIKGDVLQIAAELSQLEEKLLYPSNTHLAVFVSLSEGEEVRLDSVQIQIDGEPVAHHIYTFKELEALQKGGVQRLYTGNVRSGGHRLDVSIAGKLSGGKDFTGSETFSFEKEVEPKLVGITVTGAGFGEPDIELGSW